MGQPDGDPGALTGRGGPNGWGAPPAGPEPGAGVGIQVSVCVAGASASSRIVDDVRDMITDADYPGLGAGPEPGKAPTAHVN